MVSLSLLLVGAGCVILAAIVVAGVVLLIVNAQNGTRVSDARERWIQGPPEGDA